MKGKYVGFEILGKEMDSSRLPLVLTSSAIVMIMNEANAENGRRILVRLGRVR